MPVAADFDGDGLTHLVVYRPTEGRWYLRFSTSQYGFANWAFYDWGLPGDIPVAGDFDGDGKADLVVFRPGTALVSPLRRESVQFCRLAVIPVGPPRRYPARGEVRRTARASLFPEQRPSWWWPGSFGTHDYRPLSYHVEALGFAALTRADSAP